MVFRSIDTLRPPRPPAASAGPVARRPRLPVDPAVLRRALRVLQEALEHGDPDAAASAHAALAGLPLPESVRGVGRAGARDGGRATSSKTRAPSSARSCVSLGTEPQP